VAAKTAESKKKKQQAPKPTCPRCGSIKAVVRYAGVSARWYPTPRKTGFWWTCTSPTCDYTERTT